MSVSETKKTADGSEVGGSGSGPHPVTIARRRRPAGEKPLGIPQAELTPTVKSTVMELMQQLENLTNELSKSRDRINELENIADEDPLVPVLNRRGFMRELDRAIAYAKRYKMSLGLIFVDMNDFKKINDIFGHAAGDAALTHIGRFLVDNVRRSDIVGRLGGDEFAIVLHNASLSSVTRKSSQLMNSVRDEKLIYDGNKIHLNLTAGASELKEDDDSHDLIARADQAMYAQKPAKL